MPIGGPPGRLRPAAEGVSRSPRARLRLRRRDVRQRVRADDGRRAARACGSVRTGVRERLRVREGARAARVVRPADVPGVRLSMDVRRRVLRRPDRDAAAAGLRLARASHARDREDTLPRMARTRIVATLGPASRTEAMITALMKAG